MKINKNPSPQEVRRFALTWMAAAAGMGFLLVWRHHPLASKIAWIMAALVGFSGIAVPLAAKAFYRLWMSLAFAINYVMTHLLLAVIFWGVLSPLAILFKLAGRDALGLKRREADADSYWHEHDKMPDKTTYRHLY